VQHEFHETLVTEIRNLVAELTPEQRGSPLGTLDNELLKIADRLDAAGSSARISSPDVTSSIPGGTQPGAFAGEDPKTAAVALGEASAFAQLIFGYRTLWNIERVNVRLAPKAASQNGRAVLQRP
jgi:hypothetical protein